jgi:predicted nucleic acid-binding protein
LDDLLARRIAGSLSLKCTGTLGILVKSKQVGLIPSVSSVIATLRVQGMWLSDAVVEVMLKLSGEQLR